MREVIKRKTAIWWCGYFETGSVTAGGTASCPGHDGSGKVSAKLAVASGRRQIYAL